MACYEWFKLRCWPLRNFLQFYAAALPLSDTSRHRGLKHCIEPTCKLFISKFYVSGSYFTIWCQIILLLSYYWNSIASPLSCPWARQLSRYVPMDASSLCDTAALVGDRLKETSCSVLQERTASPAALRSCLYCKRLCAVSLHSATAPAVTRLLNVFLHGRVLYCRRYRHCDHGRRVLHIFESRMMNQLAVFVRWIVTRLDWMCAIIVIHCVSVCLSVLNNLQRSLFRGQHGANRIHDFVLGLQFYCCRL